MNYIDELKDVIHALHGVHATHVKTVPVKETWQGQTVWEGMVEIFEIHGHATATHAYAWAHDQLHPKKSSVAVLNIPPITTPEAAVRAAIAKEFRDLEAAEES